MFILKYIFWKATVAGALRRIGNLQRPQAVNSPWQLEFFAIEYPQKPVQLDSVCVAVSLQKKWQCPVACIARSAGRFYQGFTLVPGARHAGGTEYLNSLIVAIAATARISDLAEAPGLGS